MKDTTNVLNPLNAIAPQSTAVNTAIVSGIIDTQGFESAMFMLHYGALFAGSSFAVTLEHGNDPALADTAAPAATDLIGTLANAGGTQAGGLANSTRKLGYIGGKRYLRITVTPAANGATSFLSVAVVKGHPTAAPTPAIPA